MSSYISASRTNYFRVTDEEKYNELCRNLIVEGDTISHFTWEKDGILYHGFGAYCEIEYFDKNDPENDPDYTDTDFSQFLTELQ